jgi:hypothetical protein
MYNVQNCDSYISDYLYKHNSNLSIRHLSVVCIATGYGLGN